jgi:5-methyltetrahydrofolate--homocysteine methyltransferase
MSQANANNLLNRLATGKPLISDGATWTYLQQHGLKPWQCAEEFNLTNGYVVADMAKAYFEAGAEMALTNTFGGNRYNLNKYDLGDHVRDFNVEAAKLAKSQASEGQFVVGSVGPLGEFPQPLGRVHQDEMGEAYREQVSALVEGGVDGVLFETLRVIEEAEIAIKTAKENTDLVVMASMVFDRGQDGFVTIMGVSPEEAMTALTDAGADVVGANCGNGVDDMVELAKEIKRVSNGYTLINSNAGIPSIMDAEIVYPESPEYMATRFIELAKMGINIIGGCCGTGPEHIHALTEAVND